MNSDVKSRRYSILLHFLIVFCICVMIVSSVALPMTGCNNDSGVESDPTDAAYATTEPIQMIEIETPYCTLSYPQKWSDYLEYYDTNEDGTYNLSFYCYLGGKQVEMFDIYFGDCEDGNLIGYVTKDGGKVPFLVKSSDAEPDKNWTEDEQEIFFAMSEGINYIIDSVVSGDTYTAN